MLIRAVVFPLQQLRQLGEVRCEARGGHRPPRLFLIVDYSGGSVEPVALNDMSRLNGDHLVRRHRDDRRDDASSCPLGALLDLRTL
jgi:hypothetical protein